MNTKIRTVVWVCATIAMIVCGAVGLCSAVASGQLQDLKEFKEDFKNILITEVYYHTAKLLKSEFITIYNPTVQQVVLDGWYLTDFEGMLIFPTNITIQPYQYIYVVENATLFRNVFTSLPDKSMVFEYTGSNAKTLFQRGAFKLANDGDEVVLYNSDNAIVDVVIYGNSNYNQTGWYGPPAEKVPPGYVLKRLCAKNYTDTNSSADWHYLSAVKIGWSNFKPTKFEIECELTVFNSPDSTEVVSTFFKNAKNTINLSMYLFTDHRIYDAILAARAAKVAVNVLVDGNPVGGFNDREKILLSNLQKNGCSVKTMGSEIYRFYHAKYAVVDSETVIISTENFVLSKNRGWAVAVENRSVANYFDSIFKHDWQLGNDITFNTSAKIVFPAVKQTYAETRPRKIYDKFIVTPVVKPDFTISNEPILELIENARKTIYVEMHSSPKYWVEKSNLANLYLNALIEKARVGCEIKVLLDSSPHNIASGDDNDETVRYLNEIATEEHLRLEAKLVDLTTHSFSKMHTKGLIVDSKKVFIGSLNWNFNSFRENREIGVIIENQFVGNYFTTLFSIDWQTDYKKPVVTINPPRAVQINTKINFEAFVADDSKNLTFAWDFNGDGKIDCTNMSGEYVYEKIGTYQVTLTVMDAGGNVCNATTFVKVFSQTFSGEAEIPNKIDWQGVYLQASFCVLCAVLIYVLARQKNRFRMQKK